MVETADSTSPLVLVVEDDPSVQKVVIHLLRRFGFGSECATNGLEAVAAHARHPFDAISMDCQMPLMDGFEATQAIRRAERATEASRGVLPLVAAFRAYQAIRILIVATALSLIGCAGSPNRPPVTAPNPVAQTTPATSPNPQKAPRNDFKTSLEPRHRPSGAVPGSIETAASAAQMAELDRDYRLGIKAFEESRHLEAANHLVTVRRSAPHYKETESYLKRTFLAIGMERYTSGDLESAIGTWKKVLELDPKDERALAYIRRTKAELGKMDRLADRKTP